MRDGRHEHLPGVDVTFSAPKSVSLEGLVYASPRTRSRVVKAHDEAVRAALRLVETEFLMTRGYDRATGRRPRVKANGMVAAAFRHVASRNLDPQLHTHCVIANMTRDAQGTWRSAEFTALERAKRLIGAYYRKELRKRLEALGYATAATNVGDMPGFEGYRKELLASFSTRRTETLKWLADRGEEYAPARMKQAVLYTRRRKSEPAREELEAAVARPRAGSAAGRGGGAGPEARPGAACEAAGAGPAGARRGVAGDRAAAGAADGVSGGRTAGAPAGRAVAGGGGRGDRPAAAGRPSRRVRAPSRPTGGRRRRSACGPGPARLRRRALRSPARRPARSCSRLAAWPGRWRGPARWRCFAKWRAGGFSASRRRSARRRRSNARRESGREPSDGF